MGGVVSVPGRTVRVALCMALLSAAASRLVGQRLEGVWWIDVPSDAVVVAVLWEGGHDTDPVAGVLADCRLARARGVVPDLRQTGVRVVGDAAVAFVVARPGQATQQAAFVRALLDDDGPLADEVVALAIARVALAADDAAYLYPGQVLAARARAHFGAGPWASAPLGDPSTIAALAPDDVRSRLRRPVGRRVLGLGAGDDAVRPLLADVRVAMPAPSVPRPTPTTTAGRELRTEVHERIDAPFVAAAFVVADCDLGPVAVGLQVVRARAQRRFGSRYSGVPARAPFVAWSWLDGDPLVLFHRRGVDPLPKLPEEPAQRDAAFAAEVARGQLLALLEEARTLPPTEAELAEAQLRLVAELALASTTTTPLAASLLPGRAQALLLGERRGLHADAITRVDAGAVRQALQALLAPERAFWHGLLPVPRGDRTWAVR